MFFQCFTELPYRFPNINHYFPKQILKYPLSSGSKINITSVLIFDQHHNVLFSSIHIFEIDNSFFILHLKCMVGRQIYLIKCSCVGQIYFASHSTTSLYFFISFNSQSSTLLIFVTIICQYNNQNYLFDAFIDVCPAIFINVIGSAYEAMRNF